MKKCICLALCIAMLIGVAMIAPVSASAAETEDESISASGVKTQNDAVAWLNAQEGARYNLDGAYGSQCSDFTSAYVNYVLTGDPYGGRIGVYNAKEYSNAGLYPGDWQVIQNSASFVPQPGDIFVVTGADPRYGHTGVVISSNVNNATVADQNGLSDWNLDYGSPAHIHYITWSGSFTPTYFIRPCFASNDTTAPTISNARVENESENSFTLKCDLYDNVGVTRVWVVLYGPHGEAQFSVPASNGAFSHTINTADYGGPGEYAYGFYAQDAAGNSTKGLVEPIHARKHFSSSESINLGSDFLAEITNVKSGKRISADENDNVILNSIDKTDKEKWHFIRNNDGSYKIANCQTNKCLDVSGGRTNDETNIQVYQSNESVAQKWYIIKNSSGYGLVPLCCTSSALDVYGGNTSDGTNVQLYHWNQGGAQNITIDYVGLNPTATVENNGHKYEFYNNTCTWEQAYRTCEQLGGHLVTVNSLKENQEVVELVNGDCSSVWIGATKFNSNSWYWVKSEPYVENNLWASGEPNNSGGNELFVNLYTSGTNTGCWNDIPGDTDAVKGFVCEYDGIENAVNYKPSQSITIGDYLYELYDYDVDWQTANKICREKGGYLADIPDATEQSNIENLIKTGGKSEYWIGLTDVNGEGVWKWVTGTNILYSNWDSTNPNNDMGIESYVHLYKNSGKWNDLKGFSYAYHSIGFICKTKVNVEAEEIVLNKTNISLKTRESETLTATVYPSNTIDKTFTWTSSNTNVATVDNGKVTGVSAGTAVITATTSNGKTATCAVTVNNPEPEKTIKDGVYYENGVAKNPGLVKVGNDIYCTTTGGKLVYGDKEIFSSRTNGLLPPGVYHFDEVTGKLYKDNVIIDDVYYKEGAPANVGIVKVAGNYYVTTTKGVITKNAENKYIASSRTNGLIAIGYYDFGSDGKMILKNGIIGGKYYVNGKATNVGLFEYEIDGVTSIYCTTTGGVIIKNENDKFIASSRANGLVKPGYYSFDAEGKMIK